MTSYISDAELAATSAENTFTSSAPALADNIADLVGNTPLVRINKIAGDKATVLAKFEALNPGHSIKDRIALNIIRTAEAAGVLKPGGTIIEATSGNTGVGLAAMGAALGYKVIIAMPETMSKERRALMRAFGAELELTGEGGMAGAVARAEEIHEETPNSILASQFSNAANPAAHRASTALEIWEQTGGNIDVFVAGVGTGGTLSGVGKVLKDKNPDIRIIGVEPSESPLLSAGEAGPHKIQGIGANIIPDVLDQDIYDEILTIESDRAIEFARRAAAEEGLLVGISSGANLAAATELAQREEFTGKTIVTVMPDTGERYLTTPLFSHLMDA
ncbi:cysteine synthase A [Actinomyces vulturis]|uniref:cysteine synthase A n=1 Tax=Actinomyces vulturis TaxID=1857645 RepID=UPI0009F21465|nr:cysteine synthase A [Actinomyces vulturis]